MAIQQHSPEPTTWLPVAPATTADESAAPSRGREVAFLLLAAWIGFNLRAGVLGVPPVLDLIGRDARLSTSLLGLLTALPVFAFGACAIPGARMANRIGAHRTVAIGLACVTVFAALRALPVTPWVLYTSTFLLGLGVGIAQPALPAVFATQRAWVVQRAAVMVAFGYITGQLVAAAVARPLLAGHVGWRMSLAFWAIPAATCWLWWQRRPLTASLNSSGTFSQWLRAREFWLVATIMACANLCFFTANSWLGQSAPGGAAGHAAVLDYITLNAAALPVTAVLVITHANFARSRAFYLYAALTTVIGAVGWLLAPAWGPLWMTLLGSGNALTFAGAVTYPATLSPSQSPSFTGLLWTVGAVGAFLGPLLGGIAIEALHSPGAPFVAVAVGAAAIAVAASGLRSASLPAICN